MPQKDMNDSTENGLCLRQGYQCKCSQCQLWIDRWQVEPDGFATIDHTMRRGDSLFQMCERLRAEHPNVLRLHHRSIEQQCIECKSEREKVVMPLKKREVDSKALPPLPPANLEDWVGSCFF